MLLLTIFLALILLYGLFSKRVEGSMLTAPILFTAAGMVMLWVMPGMLDLGTHGQEIFLTVAEIGLVLLLFADANRIGLGMLKRVRSLAIRLLSTGMLLTIMLGALAAKLIFPEMNLWEAGILAAILAPTDAGLGQVIVTSPLVPASIRQALNVEAGLNDGLSVPFLLFFIALAGAASGTADASLAQFMLEQLGYGTVLGLALGGLGGWLLGRALHRDWMAASWKQLSVVTIPLICMLLSGPIGASMFIAAFVSGLAVQAGFEDASKHSVEFTESWGQLFNLSVFFLFGLLMARAWPFFTLQHVVYALLSLTVVRMLPVAIALFGSRLHRSTVLFMGWFGPRGLASIVLGLVYLEQQAYLYPNPEIKHAVMVTVFISILAHGLTAKPGTMWYARQVAALPATAAERLE
jgi:NhaP-type Na+/H+ or K+/H+ antiporter